MQWMLEAAEAEAAAGMTEGTTALMSGAAPDINRASAEATEVGLSEKVLGDETRYAVSTWMAMS